MRIINRGTGLSNGGQVRVVHRPHGRVPVPTQAGNGEVIAVSEGYKSKRGALGGIESVRKNAPDAPVDDKTE